MRARILKILAVAAFGMITLPLMLTNDVLSFGGFSLLRFFAYYAVFGLIFVIGYVLSRAAKKRKRLIILSRVVGILCFCPSLLLINFADSANIAVVTGICAVFWYFLGERAAAKHYADYFPAFALGVYITVTFAAYIFYGALAPEELRGPVRSAVVIFFAAELAMSAVLINQSGIYDKASRRSETRTMLPKGLSGYNAVLVLIIVSAGLGLYFFKDYIIDFLVTLVRLLVGLFLFIMRGNAEFMQIQPAEEGETPSLYLDGIGSNQAITVIFVTALLVLLIVFRKRLWKVIKSLAKRIYGLFAREQTESGKDTDFVDFLEELPAERRKNKPINDGRLLRLYRAERDPREKYRLGYRIILRELNKNKAKIVPSDTVNEQLEKGKAVCGGNFSEITRVYSALRYDDKQVTAEQLFDLEEFRKICSRN